MKIAIIGSGNVGTALAYVWKHAGHQVVMGVRNPDSQKTQQAKQQLPDVSFHTVKEASTISDVLVITTPPDAILELIPQLGDVSNKTLVDTTNSIRTRPEPHATAYHAIKHITGAHKVVKCFNSTGFENMRNPVYNGEGVDMFAAGDHAEAKAVASQLAKDAGFSSCYDFGGDDKVELLEKFALSWINLAIMQGHGRNIAFRIVRR
jgi:predicted dinucleotide-binding enzyme